MLGGGLTSSGGRVLVEFDGCRARDGERPPRLDEVRVGQVDTVRLHRRLRSREDFGVAHRVSQLGCRDLGQGVAWHHDVLLDGLPVSSVGTTSCGIVSTVPETMKSGRSFSTSRLSSTISL